MASLRSARYAEAKGKEIKSLILLRGINVGGHGRLPMKELCGIMEGLGAGNPQSYIQSGNVVIDGAVRAEAVEAAIEVAKGVRPRACQGVFENCRAESV